ncbi:MAG: hypothetical protein EOO47_24465 [Flavobacterium sp.]|nr:MAG: hypothetical protein EOO47_24465 [Flavobacterium sp.]
MSQNYNNHVRFYPPFHFVSIPLSVFGLGFAIYFLVNNFTSLNALLALAFLLIIAALLFARMNAIKAQDRAARADERLRYYILAGKMLPSELSMGQILALRFASDEEFLLLVDRTLKDNLSPKDIKLAIKKWRGDYHRI